LILLAQIETRAQTDFSAMFPEIPDCTRTIYPLVQYGASETQQAGYGTGHRVCGMITIQVMPGLKKLREHPSRRINQRRYKIRGFDVWHSASGCGVPTPVYSIDVYLSESAVISFSQYGEQADDIAKFARRANYSKLKRLLQSIIIR